LHFLQFIHFHQSLEKCKYWVSLNLVLNHEASLLSFHHTGFLLSQSWSAHYAAAIQYCGVKHIAGKLESLLCASSLSKAYKPQAFYFTGFKMKVQASVWYTLENVALPIMTITKPLLLHSTGC
jgi:hypothetical protein